ncbi:MAG: hypothetical protein AAGA75_21710, partial [Cyanobacteria bacterium P01_E01_bin.6]
MIVIEAGQRSIDARVALGRSPQPSSREEDRMKNLYITAVSLLSAFVLSSPAFADSPISDVRDAN